MLTSINICFEHQLVNDKVQMVSHYIDFKKYEYFNNILLETLANWSLKDGIDITLYNNVSIAKVINFEFRSEKVSSLQVLFMLFSFDNMKKHLKFYISKSYVIDPDIKAILDFLSLSYEIVQMDKELTSFMIKPIVSNQASILKEFIRSLIYKVNNFLKKDVKSRTLFQTYHSTKDLVPYLNNKFAVDVIPSSINKILSSNSVLYLNLILYRQALSEETLNFSLVEEKSIQCFVKLLVEKYFRSVEKDIKKNIDSFKQALSQNKVQNVVLMSEIPTISSIIMQLIHNINGKVYLLNHGVRDYSHSTICHNISEVDGIFCWSSYEQSTFNALNIKSIKSGYPIFLEKSITPKKQDINKNSKILFLPELHAEYWETCTKKGVDDLIEIITKLLTQGYAKENIFVKIHPGAYNIKFFEEILYELIPLENLYQRQNTYEVIKSVDLVVGPYSTTVYETIFLGKPYLTYSSYNNVYGNSIFQTVDLPIFYTIDGLIEGLNDFEPLNIEKLKEELLYKTSYQQMAEIISKEINNE